MDLIKHIQIQCEWSTMKIEHQRLMPKVFSNACVTFTFTPTVDAFASDWNAQCALYWTKETDAFTQDWSVHDIYANPPWSLLDRVVEHIVHHKLRVMLVFPIWKSAPWFRRLQPMIHSAFHPPMAPFEDEHGKRLPPPRWRTLIAMVHTQWTGGPQLVVRCPSLRKHRAADSSEQLQSFVDEVLKFQTACGAAGWTSRSLLAHMTTAFDVTSILSTIGLRPRAMTARRVLFITSRALKQRGPLRIVRATSSHNPRKYKIQPL